MQIFLFILVLTLIVINVRQTGELRGLERKTLEAFKIVCRNFDKIKNLTKRQGEKAEKTAKIGLF